MQRGGTRASDRPVVAAIPAIPGVLSAQEVVATAASIADVQRHDGMIPWFEGGHCDPGTTSSRPWPSACAGLHKEATLAYQWLADTQLPDGSWFNYYLAASGVKDPRLDTNVCAYVATGAWHNFLVTGDVSVLAAHVAGARQGARVRAALPARRRGDPAGRSIPTGTRALPVAHRIIVDLPRAAVRRGVRRDAR